MKSVGYSSNGPLYVYGGDSNLLYIVNGSSNNNTVMSQFIYPNTVINSIDFSDDGNNLIVGSSDGMLYEYSKYCLYCIPGYYPNSTSNKCVQC
jgi:WD40 repeat protein